MIDRTMGTTSNNSLYYLVAVLLGVTCQYERHAYVQAFLPSPVLVRYPSTRAPQRFQTLLSTTVKEKERIAQMEGGEELTRGKRFPYLNGRQKSHLVNPRTEVVNGDTGFYENATTVPENSTKDDSMVLSASQAAEDLIDLIDEINNRISNGTADLLKNLTESFDDKLVRLPDTSSSELSSYLADLTAKIQRAQQDELERQLIELERRFVRPLEELAFSDAPLFVSKSDGKGAGELIAEYDADLQRSELVLIGENSTLGVTRRMRTKDILRNLNVAPLYYSVALLLRWVRKASYPSLYLLSFYKWFGSLIKSNTKAARRDRSTMGGERLQSGWKRTGEIAAKGPLAKKWAIMRRSAEIWAYFSSFYLKDRHITAKFKSGKWTEERFKKERSKLGAEITNNLLKLGPVRSNQVRKRKTERKYTCRARLISLLSLFCYRRLSKLVSCSQLVLTLFRKSI